MPDTRRTPRERMVFSAAQLIRQQGVNATGLREVVVHADAPRGSIQHYFPEGKEQLVNEAVAWAGRYASGRIAKFLAGMAKPSPSRLFAAMVQQWVDEFTTVGFSAGCPLAAATVDCADGVESTRRAVVAGFGRWRGAIAAALSEMGVPARKSTAVATLMLSSLEGAIVLARAEHDVRALRTVVRELGPLLDGYVPGR
jgi:AcrR family transcriptional regulator